MDTARRVVTTPSERPIAYRTMGHAQGPVTRLMSPGDLGGLVKPFVFLDLFDFDGGRSDGGVVHPHSGIATHTTLLEGSLRYGDSTGKRGTLLPGSVEWMQAGGGVWHGGTPLPGQRIRGFQLWMALSAEHELAPAESQYVDASEVVGDGRVRVLLGSYGAMRSPIRYDGRVTYLNVRLHDGEHWTFEPPAGHDVAWLAVSAGTAIVAGAELRRELAVFEEGDGQIVVAARGELELVIGSAAKHPHPLVTGYYSVHTSRRTLALGEAGIERVAETMTLRPGLPLSASPG